MYYIAQKNGNVLFLILIAVALFGALSFAVTSTSRNTDQNMVSEGQASTAASVIMQYGDEVQTALNRLITTGGCDIAQISFDYDTSSTTGYENSNAPTNNSCHVFHPNGGGASYRAAEDKWLDGVGSGTFYGDPAFATSCVHGMGAPYSGNCSSAATAADNAELVMIVPYLNETVCQQINKKLRGDETIPGDNHNMFLGTRFTGGFNVSTAQLDFSSPFEAYNSGFSSGCFTSVTSGSTLMGPGRYAYFTVLYTQ